MALVRYSKESLNDLRQKKKTLFMSLILRVGWVWTLEKYVIKVYVTNWEGMVGLNPNMYNVTLLTLFF